MSDTPKAPASPASGQPQPTTASPSATAAVDLATGKLTAASAKPTPVSAPSAPSPAPSAPVSPPSVAAVSQSPAPVSPPPGRELPAALAVPAPALPDELATIKVASKVGFFCGLLGFALLPALGGTVVGGWALIRWKELQPGKAPATTKRQLLPWVVAGVAMPAVWLILWVTLPTLTVWHHQSVVSQVHSALSGTDEKPYVKFSEDFKGRVNPEQFSKALTTAMAQYQQKKPILTRVRANVRTNPPSVSYHLSIDNRAVELVASAGTGKVQQVFVDGQAWPSTGP